MCYSLLGYKSESVCNLQVWLHTLIFWGIMSLLSKRLVICVPISIPILFLRKNLQATGYFQIVFTVCSSPMLANVISPTLYREKERESVCVSVIYTCVLFRH